MYAPSGFHGPELGDVEVVSHDGQLHLFHLTLPNHDVVQHVVSTDGLRWQPVAPALFTGAPGEPDDDMIWTCGIVPDGGAWLMLYTALARAEQGRVQRIAAASSPDLIHWTKRGVASQADPRWYDAAIAPDAPDGAFVSWRDPKPVVVDGERWATVCARTNEGPVARRGAVAVLRERQGRWEAAPPLYAPGRWSELECPQLFRVGARWYLTASILDDRSQRYWISDGGPTGPFRTPERSRLLPDGHYAARVVRHGETDAAFCWHEPPGPTHGQRVDRRTVPSPLSLEARADGTLRAVPWPGWQARRAPWVAVDRPGAAPIGDAGVFELARLPRAFELAMVIRQSATFVALGIGDGGDDATQGLWVELDRGEGRLRLVQTGPGRSTAHPWIERTVLQESPARIDDRPTELRIRAARETEVVRDGEVLLSTTADAPPGRLLVLVDGGEAELSDVRWAPVED